MTTVPTASTVNCDYCQQSAELVTGKEIYPHRQDLGGKKFWRCLPCQAFVGCHEPGNGYGDGTRPLGRLANLELRKAKKDAHAVFDALWQSRRMNRKAAYALLSKLTAMPADKCHIGMMDVEQCRQVVDAVSAWELTQ